MKDEIQLIMKNLFGINEPSIDIIKPNITTVSTIHKQLINMQHIISSKHVISDNYLLPEEVNAEKFVLASLQSHIILLSNDPIDTLMEPSKVDYGSILDIISTYNHSNEYKTTHKQETLEDYIEKIKSDPEYLKAIK
jgi:hypothetical protein